MLLFLLFYFVRSPTLSLTLFTLFSFIFFSLAFCAEKNMNKYLSYSGNIFSFIFAFGVFAYTYLIHKTCLANKINFTIATSYKPLRADTSTDRQMCLCAGKGHANRIYCAKRV